MRTTIQTVTVGVTSVVIVKAIKSAFIKFWPLIKDANGMGWTAALGQTFQMACKRLAFGGRVAVAAVSEVLYACWEGALSVCLRGEVDRERHAQNFRSACSMDNVARNLFILAVPTLAAAGIGSGVLPIAFMTMFAGCVYDSVVASRTRCGGWMPYLRSFVVGTDNRIRQWESALFESVEEHITEELRCCITHEIVVDPLRSTFNGRIYERGAILRWVRDNGRDPLWRETLATEADYVAAPQAARVARRFAEMLSAEAVFVDDR